MYYSSPSYIDRIGYSLIDFNDDGVKELLIGMRTGVTEHTQGIIYELYTYVDDKIIQLATSGERYFYQLCKDYTIYYEGTDGAYPYLYNHYQLSCDASNF